MANDIGWGAGASNNDIGWGTGFDNEIGWGVVQLNSWSGETEVAFDIKPKFDTDAQTFMTSASITDETQQTAINSLVLDLKKYELWNLMTAIYPFVGGNSTSHSYNLKNTSAYQITWYGGVTHNINGVTGNGTNAYGNTGLNDQTILSINNKHLSMYQRNILSSPSGSSMGIGNNSRFYLNYASSNYSSLGMNQNPFTVQTPQKGVFIMSKTANGQFNYYQNSLASVTKTGTNSSVSANHFVLACNTASAPFDYSVANLSFASYGQGLSDANVSILRTLIEDFQTTLNRNV